MSRGWANALACRLHVSLSCAVLCQIVSLQNLSRSSFHRLTGLPCRLFLSYHLQVVTCKVHRSSLKQDQFIFFTLLITCITFVCFLTQMNIGLSIYDVEHTSFHLGLCGCKFILCLFGQCPCLCTICHS